VIQKLRTIKEGV